MKIYLMRHAEAVPGSAWSGKDRDRPLSPKGEAALQAAAPVIGAQLPKPDALLSSPYFRAEETAELIARAWEDLQVVQLPELASGARPDAIRHAIQLHRHVRSIFVVGHIPDLATFIGRITGDIHLMEESIAAGEMVAVDTLDASLTWGSGRLAWRKRLQDWKE